MFESRKLTYKITRINTTSTTHPTLSFYLRETYSICNFLAKCHDYTREQNKALVTGNKNSIEIFLLYLTGPIASVDLHLDKSLEATIRYDMINLRALKS